MRALPFQAPAPHVYIRMRQANIEKRLSKSWPKKIRAARAFHLAQENSLSGHSHNLIPPGVYTRTYI